MIFEHLIKKSARIIVAKCAHLHALSLSAYAYPASRVSASFETRFTYPAYDHPVKEFPERAAAGYELNDVTKPGHYHFVTQRGRSRQYLGLNGTVAAIKAAVADVFLVHGVT
jgi:hypothetical protein